MKQKERRKFHRIACYADIHLKGKDSSNRIAAKCVDISIAGIGIALTSPSTVDLYSERPLEIWIHLTNTLTPIHRYGKIVWLKKADSLAYRGGIKFAPSKTLLEEKPS